jgi:hypothetical protein
LSGGNIVFTVTLTQALTAPATVDYATSNGSAIAGTDYTAGSGTLTFPAGTTSETISIPVTVNTTAPTGSKVFTLTLSNASSNANIVAASATGTIVEGALSSVQLTVTAPAPAVGNAGGNLVFTVVLNQAATSAVTVNYATSDGTAIAGTDYTAESGTLTFPAGTTTQTVTVPVATYNGAVTLTKTFTLTLSNSSSNASIVGSTATGTINDTAVVPQISISTPSPISDANGGNLIFTVTLSQAAASVVTVDYATADNTAFAGFDYTAESGTLTFPVGTTSETISVPVLLDTGAGFGSTMFTVALSNPTNATIDNTSAVGTINDVPVSTTQFSAGNPAKYIDSAGKVVELALSGPGQGEAVFVSSAADPVQIILDNTTANSTFTVRSAADSVGNIVVNGSLLAMNAKSTSLNGNLTVSGSLQKLTLGDASGANGSGGISIGAAGTPGIFNLGSLSNENLSTPGAIATLKIDGSLTGGAITAASINRLTIAGAMSNAALSLSGSGQTLANFTVTQAVNNSQIRSAGNIGKVTVGAFAGSDLFAGVDPGVSTLPTTSADFSQTDSIANFTVTGKTNSYFFSDSNIAAASIGDVVLGRVDPNNNGNPFGVATKHLSAITNRGVMKWTSKKPVSLLMKDGDFVVSLL